MSELWAECSNLGHASLYFDYESNKMNEYILWFFFKPSLQKKLINYEIFYVGAVQKGHYVCC